jgi:hypothetical protein
MAAPSRVIAQQYVLSASFHSAFISAREISASLCQGVSALHKNCMTCFLVTTGKYSFLHHRLVSPVTLKYFLQYLIPVGGSSIEAMLQHIVQNKKSPVNYVTCALDLYYCTAHLKLSEYPLFPVIDAVACLSLHFLSSGLFVLSIVILYPNFFLPLLNVKTVYVACSKHAVRGDQQYKYQPI